MERNGLDGKGSESGDFLSAGLVATEMGNKRNKHSFSTYLLRVLFDSFTCLVDFLFRTKMHMHKIITTLLVGER